MRGILEKVKRFVKTFDSECHNVSNPYILPPECGDSGSMVPDRRGERGAVNIAGIMMMGIGMIFLAVAFIVFPIITSGTDSILAYTYSSNTAINYTTFTGLTAVTGIVPLLALLGIVTAGVVTGFLGYKITREGNGGAKMDPGSLMMLSIGVIFLAVGLIIFPVVLDGVSSALHNSGSGLSSSYTGLTNVLGVTPLLVLVGFTFAGIVVGFFGIKGMAAHAKGG